MQLMVSLYKWWLFLFWLHSKTWAIWVLTVMCVHMELCCSCPVGLSRSSFLTVNARNLSPLFLLFLHYRGHLLHGVVHLCSHIPPPAPPRFILFLIQMYCTWETYFPSICRMCSGSRKCGPWSNSMRTTWELVRKARSWGPFQTYWIRPSGGGASNLGFKKPPRWPWCTLKFENHCSSGNWCGKGPAYEEAVIHLWKQAPREQQ